MQTIDKVEHNKLIKIYVCSTKEMVLQDSLESLKHPLQTF